MRSKIVGKRQQRVRFVRRAAAAHLQPPASSTLPRDHSLSVEQFDSFLYRDDLRTDGINSFSSYEIDFAGSPGIMAHLHTSLPVIRDLLHTGTSNVQDETIQECLPYLAGNISGVEYNAHGVPHLDRRRHVDFLHKSLKRLPAGYVAMDASRPWMFYWVLSGLAAMGEDPSQYRERLISTVRPIQNPGGGFGGGNGQMSHLAPTYAILLSLVMVGGEEAFEVIDRKAMWKWLGSLKQPDGGFQMSVGGEEDVR